MTRPKKILVEDDLKLSAGNVAAQLRIFIIRTLLDEIKTSEDPKIRLIALAKLHEIAKEMEQA